MSEPKMCGRCWEASQMSIYNRPAARTLEVELIKTLDATISLGSLNLHTIPRIGREVHLWNYLQARTLVSSTCLCNAMLKKHLASLTVLDANIKCHIACNL